MVLQKENQYSQGKRVFSIAAKYAEGEYLAFCEGDDFWIDSNKLSHQKNIFDSNPKCSLVVHQCLQMRGDHINPKPAMGHGSEQRDIGKSEVVSFPYQFSPTASYLIKANIFDILPDWYQTAPVGDYFLESYSFKLGDVIYSPCTFSVYRRQAEGSWTVDTNESGEKLKKFSLKMYKSLELMKKDPFFSDSNIEKKMAASLFGAAKGALLEHDFIEFQENIKKSVLMHKRSSHFQKLLFLLRRFPLFARFMLVTYKKLV